MSKAELTAEEVVALERFRKGRAAREKNLAARIEKKWGDQTNKSTPFKHCGGIVVPYENQPAMKPGDVTLVLWRNGVRVCSVAVKLTTTAKTS